MRYWLAAGLFLSGVLVVTIGVGWGVFGLNPVLLGVLAAAAYGLAIGLDVLPPGRPGSGSGNDLDEPLAQGTGSHEWDPEPYDDRDRLVRTEGSGPLARSERLPLVLTVFALLAAGLGVGIGWLSTRGDDAASSPFDGDGDATSTAVATTSDAATPTATPVPNTPSATATTPRPTATAVPATPTPLPPTPPATPAPTSPGAATERQSSIALSGRWLLTDTVTSGTGTSETYQFVIDVVEEGGQVSGAGSDLRFSGQRSGSEVSVSYVRTGGSGEFAWTITPEGTLVGTFRDAGAGNSGTSIGTRVY